MRLFAYTARECGFDSAMETKIPHAVVWPKKKSSIFFSILMTMSKHDLGNPRWLSDKEFA